MQIRVSLTIRFIFIVSTILLAVLLSIYLYTQYYLSESFYRRLSNRTETTAELYFVVDDVDSTLLRTITDRNKNVLHSENITIYNQNKKKVFTTNDRKGLPLTEDLMTKIQLEKKYRFRDGKYHGVGLYYTQTPEPYFIVASAVDDYGRAFLAQMRLIMVLLFLIVILWVSAAGWYYAGKAIAPIDDMGQKLNSIVPKNMHLRLNQQDNQDEIDRLTHTINQLLDRVEDTFKLQRMFVSNVSHELRNPLTKMSSQLEVSLIKTRTPQEYQKTMYSVLDDIQELIALTQNLLKLTKVDGVKQDLLVDKVRVDELLWEVRGLLTKSNALYQIEILFDELPEDPDGLCMLGNSALLKTAIVNLAENACKFSFDKKAIIRLRCLPDEIQIAIEDKGIGIQESELSYIFQPFYRSSQTADIKGYGIGLSLVERIARMHGGTVDVKSSPNIGTTFTLVLPSNITF
ncbi:sensor histidine kinase [Flectobacillus roseus]|uniref:histidine kinase n=1 Tax=Flectobacillus roseus TaxID=502259 RepID=A0ABT6YDN5_9BACT|nr:HAMP domain-containing sensor histidine kinase [Flectobacillus roseus]MDI9861549.1 HAMP domain-containing sensor histidine kinase [Flectobacillus roseus]MDI9868713.1 HAMP domain-containing sensor histidine kinase [Flectobacillus roseus]